MQNEPINNVTITINGKMFRCECGCNVFHHPCMETWEEEMTTYKCNACGNIYKGE